MANHDIANWISQSRANGKTDKQIREELQQNGWLSSQIDQALEQADAEPISRAITKRKMFTTAPRAWTTMGMVLVVVVVAVALYFVNDHYHFVGHFGNTNTSTNSAAGSFPTVDAQLDAQSQLQKFSSYDDVATYLANNTQASYYGGMGTATLNETRDIAVEALPTPIGSSQGETFGLGTADLKAAPSANIIPDYSATNVQVEGVDEGDIVKTDGDYIYAISEKNLFIIDARPAGEMQIMSTIVFDNAPQDIYLDGDRMIVYGSDWTTSERPVFDTIRSTGFTYVKIFDISDRANPAQVRHLDFEGSYSQSRMIGDYLYLVTTQPTYVTYDDNPVPILLDDDAVVPLGERNGFNPDVYYIDAPYYAQIFTTVSAVNVMQSDAAVNADVFLLSGAEQLYVSLDNMYVAYTKYVDELSLTIDIYKQIIVPKLTAAEQQQITDIEAAPNHVLSVEEKTQKILTVMQRYVSTLSSDAEEALQAQIEQAIQDTYDDISKELEKTVVHRIAIDKGSLTYEATGEVTGHILNQFSMDEHDGYLRIATTKGQTWSRFDEGSSQSYNNLYILDQNMKQVGAVENLAEGEQIYSVRFMQNRAYLVTFRQTDPLYAIDVSDPRNPTVLGQLKVPGFSSYLHPYNDNLLIGFGKQADDDGRVQGLKLSLFDVSDVNNLREVDTYEMGDRGSDSIALNDHKAFLFDRDKNLLVVPVSLRDVTGDIVGNYTTHGAAVFTVTPDGFTYRDQINHSDGSEADNQIDYFYSYQYYDTMVKRSLYIDDILYTLSNKYLKAHQLSDLAAAGSLELTTGDGNDFTILR